ncbi:MAG: hypothetical protein IJ593_12405 [Lachnospiraceae bacterium]|nr:hypothetical protein [Lachnospiraceae bacterium]
MIASLRLLGKYNVGVNSLNKVKVDGHLLLLKEIPFVRYNFGNYDDSDIEFIKQNMQKFKSSTHLIEINLDENTPALLDKLNEVNNLAKFIYVPIDNIDIANGLSPDKIKNLEAIVDYEFDRVMLKDNAQMLYEVAADRLKATVEKTLDGVVRYRDIGICGSPLSFKTGDADGQACLTAVWARKIMAAYATDSEIETPTASHECMKCGGCVRYFTVESDIPAPLTAEDRAAKSAEKKAKASENSDNTDKTKKEVKPQKPKGISLIDF